MTHIELFEAECRCGREISTVAPKSTGHDTRWVRGECGHILKVRAKGQSRDVDWGRGERA